MNARVRGLIAPAVATVVCSVLLIGLGVWQLHRLAWKEALIAAVETRARAAPRTRIPPTSDMNTAGPSPASAKLRSRSQAPHLGATVRKPENSRPWPQRGQRPRKPVMNGESDAPPPALLAMARRRFAQAAANDHPAAPSIVAPHEPQT